MPAGSGVLVHLPASQLAMAQAEPAEQSAALVQLEPPPLVVEAELELIAVDAAGARTLVLLTVLATAPPAPWS